VFLYGYRNKQQVLLYASLKIMVFITEAESVYYAVRTDSLYNGQVSCLKGSEDRQCTCDVILLRMT